MKKVVHKSQPEARNVSAPGPRACSKLRREWAALLRSLKGDIADDFRASDDAEDSTPGMCVTFGVTWRAGEFSWSYQTGDNSFTGGAYGHRTWSVVSLYRRSNCAELSAEAVAEALELLPD